MVEVVNASRAGSTEGKPSSSTTRRRLMNSMHYRLSISRCLPANSCNNRRKHIQISSRWHTSNIIQFKLIGRTFRWRISKPYRNNRLPRCHIRRQQSFSLNLTPLIMLRVRLSDIMCPLVNQVDKNLQNLQQSFNAQHKLPAAPQQQI